MAKDIEATLHLRIDCSKLTHEEREAQLARLHAVHQGALETMFIKDITTHSPHLVDKWVGLTAKLEAH